MTTKFPLYDSLNNLVSNEVVSLTPEIQLALSQKIKKFARNAHELIYALNTD